MRRVPCLQGILNDTTTSPFSSYTAKQSDIAFPVSLWYDFYLNPTPSSLFVFLLFSSWTYHFVSHTLTLKKKKKKHAFSEVFASGVVAEANGPGFSLIVSLWREGSSDG